MCNGAHSGITQLVCPVAVSLQAIDLIDEAGSRVRISAYNARKEGAVREDPKVDEYLQVRPGMRCHVCIINNRTP